MSANDILFRVLLGTVLLTPIPFGANRPWAWSLMAFLTALLLAAWGLNGALNGQRRPVALKPLLPIVIPFALVVLWAVFQALPLAPESWRHPLWAEAAGALGTPVEGAITLDPARTRSAVMKLLAYGGIFLLAYVLGRHAGRARLALTSLAIAGGLYAAYGLVGYLTGADHILWFSKWAYIGDLTATFVNRNAYGAYAGIGLLCCLARIIELLQRARTATGARHYAEVILIGCLPYAVGAVVLATALLLTHSRGALIATAIAVAVLLVSLLASRTIRPRQFLASAVAIGLTAGLMTLTTGEETVDRMLNMTEVSGDRGQLTRLSLQAIGDAPLTGFGAGAFAPAFRLYRDTALPRPVVYDYAHDIYLDAALELGVPAAAIFALALATIAFGCARGLVHRRGQIHAALALSALALFLVHGLADFSVEIPANAATLALLMGIGLAQARLRSAPA